MKPQARRGQWRRVLSLACSFLLIGQNTIIVCSGFLHHHRSPSQSRRHSQSPKIPTSFNSASTSSSLNLFRKIFRRRRQKELSIDNIITEERNPATSAKPQERKDKNDAVPSETDVLIIGGGISGIAAAITAASAASNNKSALNVTVIEAGPRLGGRVKSVVTADGYTLDEGFQVFIENYPQSKQIFDYEALKLRPFLPGALVKLEEETELARVSDPLRQPQQLLSAVTSPVGSLADKLRLIPLILNLRMKTIEQLFEEEIETDTETALRTRWGFSAEFVDTFFRPFLEGIYLSPLSEQSSRMLSFVLKMFFEGAAALPQGGIGKIIEQLATKARDLGVDFRMEMPATQITLRADGTIHIQVEGNNDEQSILAKSVVIATDEEAASKLLVCLDGFDDVLTLPKQPQRSVGALYYAFKGNPPVEEPILILNGMKGASRDNESPINNVCFPSSVNSGFSPDGFSLCSVAVLEDAMEAFKGQHDLLDKAVRKQLALWFPQEADDIMNTWELKSVFDVSE